MSRRLRAVLLLATSLIGAGSCAQIGQTTASVATTVVTQADAQSYLDSYARELATPVSEIFCGR